jgi:glycosyltransferase involved in cell wall biosynthesis
LAIPDNVVVVGAGVGGLARPASVSVVLPAYNEEAVIATTVRRSCAAVREAGFSDFEVIVVNDGSSDGTEEACRLITSELGAVRVVSHANNQGYGAALRSGFESAVGEAVLLMDSDGQFDPRDLRLLLEHWDGATVVCGYRTRRADPMIRRLNHFAFFTLVNALFGTTARDVNCGFKLFPREVGQGLTSEGALVSTELLLRARQRHFRVVDVGVSHYPRLTGVPTGARLRVIARAAAELWRLRATLRRSRAVAGQVSGQIPAGPRSGP